MSQLPIVQVGPSTLYAKDTCLRMTSKALNLENDSDLKYVRSAIPDMLYALYSDPSGVALAAPQIGLLSRIIVIDFEDRATRERRTEVLVNPKILLSSNELIVDRELCLSVPRFVGSVSRARMVEVEAADQHGKMRTIKAEGYYARVLQHEIDHLNGILYIDKVIQGTLEAVPDYPIRRAKPTLGKLKLL